jgi:hypothetical protein
MNRFCLPLTLVLSLAFLSSMPGATGAAFDGLSTVPTSELARGDTLTGLTALSPDGVRPFELVVVGVIEGSAPGRDLIVARALGEPFEEVGIVQGMSGSPVYRDGRLVGAVAAAWSFSTKPMAAVTPIGAMLALADGAEMGSGADAGSVSPLGIIPESERASSRTALLAGRLGGAASHEAAPLRLAVHEGREVTALPLPLSFPASASFRRRVAPVLERLGLTPIAAPAGSGAGADGELVPGSPVGALLVGGDLVWAATGTLTHREGDLLLAFGHPLFGGGRTAIPLTSATALDVVPLQSVSFRLSAVGPVVGTLVRDGEAGIVAELGDVPPTIPVRLELEGPGLSRTFDFTVASVRPFSHLFASLASGAAISEVYRTTGRTTTRLSASVTTDRETVEYEDVFATAEPAMRVGGELATLLNVLGDSPLAERRIESVSVRVEFSEGWGWYRIERVAAATPVVQPGGELTVRVTLRPWRGDPFERSLTLAVPQSAREGDLVVRIGGPSEYHEWDAERLGAGAAPRTYEQLVELVEGSRPGNELIAQALSDRGTLSLAGRELGSVPGRAALAMGAGGAGGAADPTEMSVVSETSLQLDNEVTGYHEIVVRVSKGPGRP